MTPATVPVLHVPAARVHGDGPIVFPGCSCRWLSDRGYDPAAALAVHSEHVTAFEAITVPDLNVGDRVRFDGKATSWLVRATAAGGRYAICTGSIFGVVHYTVVDRLEQIRGAVNVIGYGLGIATTSGPDDGVACAVRMLEHRPDLALTPDADPNAWDGLSWGVSHRNRVPLHITGLRPATATAWRAA